MLISASRRTDIPAFFGDWFMRRVEAGFFVAVNPFNPNQAATHSLAPDAVDAIAFWTKDPAPFMVHLDALDARGYRYYFMVTLNDYPPAFEPGVPPLARRIETFRRLSDRIGPQRVIWRYDPIIISSATPIEYHLERLAHLTTALAGRTERMIISFLDFYSKVRPRLRRLSAREGVAFADIASPEQREQLIALAGDINRLARGAGMRVQTCCESVDLSAAGIRHGACIDAEHIENTLGAPRRVRPAANQRHGCLCAHSVDVGAYNTCRFQCVYCYATLSESAVLANRDRHSVDGPTLLERQVRAPVAPKHTVFPGSHD